MNDAIRIRIAAAGRALKRVDDALENKNLDQAFKHLLECRRDLVIVWDNLASMRPSFFWGEGKEALGHE